jgi:hypothetical protein
MLYEFHTKSFRSRENLTLPHIHIKSITQQQVCTLLREYSLHESRREEGMKSKVGEILTAREFCLRRRNMNPSW